MDRLGHIDLDDIYLLGAATGIAVASAVRRPWSISGWKRFVGAGALGATVSVTLAVKIAPLFVKKEELEKLAEKMRVKQGWALVEAKAVLMFAENQTRMAGIPIPSAAGIPSLPGKLAPGVDSDSSLEAIVAGILESDRVDRYKIGADATPSPNEADEPHLVGREADDLEPAPYANTNYTWSRPTEQAISELHSHIGRLQERRQKLAHEAELLWHWLAQKELELYNIPSGPGLESDEKLEARRYVEIVGTVHTKVWDRVTRCDWMISDSRKRIEQLQSAQSSGDGRMSWMPGLSVAAAQARPEVSARYFKEFYKVTEQRKESLAKLMKALEKGLSLIPPSGIGGIDGMNAKPNMQAFTKQNLKAELLEKVRSQVDALEFDAKVMSKVLEDVERVSSNSRQ